MSKYLIFGGVIANILTAFWYYADGSVLKAIFAMLMAIWLTMVLGLVGNE